jgi:hypothetical protein
MCTILLTNAVAAPEVESKPRSKRTVGAHFSRNHFADNESCCLLVALPSAVAR